MIPVICIKVGQGISCITTEQEGIIRGMMKRGRGKIGHATDEESRGRRTPPAEQELLPPSSGGR